MSKFAEGRVRDKAVVDFHLWPAAGRWLLVMAEAIAAGNHPYETKIPLMTTTIGADYRKRMFGWIKEQDHQPVREPVGRQGGGLFFAGEPRLSRSRQGHRPLLHHRQRRRLLVGARRHRQPLMRTYLADYRGVIKWLVHNHVPFDIVVRPDAKELARFDVVIAPALAALSDAKRPSARRLCCERRPSRAHGSRAREPRSVWRQARGAGAEVARTTLGGAGRYARRHAAEGGCHRADARSRRQILPGVERARGQRGDRQIDSGYRGSASNRRRPRTSMSSCGEWATRPCCT